MNEYQHDIQRLIQLLRHPDLSRRGEAALALTGMGRIAVEPLIDALGSANPDMMQWSAAILGQIRDQRAIDPLIDLLERVDPATRSSIVRALGSMGSERVVQRLIAALTDPEPRVRSTAALSLGQLKRKESIEPLIHALSDPSTYVRAQALWALREIGDQGVLQALMGITGETDPIVLKALKATISHLQEKERSDHSIRTVD